MHKKRGSGNSGRKQWAYTRKMHSQAGCLLHIHLMTGPHEQARPSKRLQHCTAPSQWRTQWLYRRLTWLLCSSCEILFLWFFLVFECSKKSWLQKQLGRNHSVGWHQQFPTWDDYIHSLVTLYLCGGPWWLSWRVGRAWLLQCWLSKSGQTETPRWSV